uniref:H15 domain-containing protein n=1 Tax=Cyprinus carpio TaxID=7962 RepID=A0A8C2C254_CYPCA
MAETAPAATVPPAKAPKKKSAAKAKKAGPAVGDLIVKAVSASKERSGVSLAALKKALAAGGYDVEKKNSRIKLAIKSLVTKGDLTQEGQETYRRRQEGDQEPQEGDKEPQEGDQEP